ncbi:MAG: hypothetical protein A2161_07575 [Candidatus Schekmanbacteria bacterium RBG_13_48_7]|uniref:HTH merR-type domain-containing protein n=1 Tax=Candidatus Schekmanbacteria bacterium RBG_13_48_7 TaxID=1817878 RepID=A0A1F7S306_9BACT|nr:MAG: hypothetical protein A2161_07575 [Candidatus Schekmanbacteria bacterium RBG_13_48_7]
MLKYYKPIEAAKILGISMQKFNKLVEQNILFPPENNRNTVIIGYSGRELDKLRLNLIEVKKQSTRIFNLILVVIISYW